VKPKRIGVARKAAALTCQAGASDNKGRSRVTIAPTKGDQMYLAVGHRGGARPPAPPNLASTGSITLGLGNVWTTETARPPTGHRYNNGRATTPAPRCSGSSKPSDGTHRPNAALGPVHKYAQRKMPRRSRRLVRARCGSPDLPLYELWHGCGRSCQPGASVQMGGHHAHTLPDFVASGAVRAGRQ
jgi:hypothetical protein